jgi:integrase
MRGLVDANPVMGTERNKEYSRERVLAAAELRTIWNALEDDHYGAIVKLLALTAQRAGEIGGLCWSEIGDKAITLSGERTKNKRAHVIPLSETARAIIAKQPHRADRDLIFGIGDGPFAGWSGCKAKLDARIKKATGKALPHWTPHDLRRTAATQMAGLGVQPHIIEAVLNHVGGHKGGVAGIYNRSTYEPEKRTALDLWANHLAAIVAGRTSNVTTPKKGVTGDEKCRPGTGPRIAARHGGPQGEERISGRTANAN